MRKGEAQQRLLDFFLSTCHTRSGWLTSLVGFLLPGPEKSKYNAQILVHFIHMFHIDISLQCNDYQGESYESCGKPSEWSNFLLKKICTFLNKICQGEAAMLATKRVVAPMRAALGNININTRFEFSNHLDNY